MCTPGGRWPPHLEGPQPHCPRLAAGKRERSPASWASWEMVRGAKAVSEETIQVS